MRSTLSSPGPRRCGANKDYGVFADVAIFCYMLLDVARCCCVLVDLVCPERRIPHHSPHIRA
eukprot:2245464-Lingulodinium_polyedra.AAC.1